MIYIYVVVVVVFTLIKNRSDLYSILPFSVLLKANKGISVVIS